MTVIKLKCPVMNRRSAEESLGYASPAVPNYDILVRIKSKDCQDVIDGIICPEYRGKGICGINDRKCPYLSGWQTKE